MRPGSETRALARALAEAPEQRLAKAVALLDALPARGAADALIAPLRGQFRTMGIPRRMNFGRLLMLPLDPVIRDATDWVAASATVPRTALPPLIAAVRAALPDLAVATEAGLQGATDAASATLCLGPGLWSAAVAPLRALAAASPPADLAASWAATGLAARMLAPLARGVAAVLEAAAALRDPTAPEDPIQLVERVLDTAALHGAQPWALVVAAALARAADPAGVALVAIERALSGDPALHQGMEQALAATITGLEQEMQAPIRAAAATASRAARLIETMAPRAGPGCRVALAAFGGRMARTCRARFAAELEANLLVPLRSEPAVTGAPALAALEHVARGLRGFEAAARRIDTGSSYDILLRQAVGAVSAVPGPILERVDRARLVEILAGPEAAMDVLGG
ncbi:MAG: hypothetical protein HIU82_22440 [Proteobacteria bacterium]|nr:hypothetical protein [Pseudomonadota bacterium]